MKTREVLIAATAILATAVSLALPVTSVRINALDKFGGDTGAALVRCQTKAGAEYDPVTVTRDVTTLRESGEFEEIAAEAKGAEGGIEVVFNVRRKLRYQAPLVIRGADEFSESKIAEESGLKDGYLYGEGDFAAAAEKVRRAYEKKYYSDAKVTVKPEPIPGANGCTVTVTVDEGVRHKIRDYLFEGGWHLERKPWWNPAWWQPEEGNIDEDELRDALNDYPWWNPLGWFSDAPVTADAQMQCVAKLEEIYRNHGYLDARVRLPRREVDPESGKVDLVFRIDEGDRYFIGDQTVEGVTRYPVETVVAKAKLPAEGTVAGAKELEDAAHRIKVVVGSGDSGLADTRVDVKRIPSGNAGTRLDIVYRVTEGVPVVIDEIVIRGNDYTKDKVLRREIALAPGDRMLEDRAERSQKRLENLNYFERVRYYLEPSDLGKDKNGAEYRNLVYEVEEKSTGQFMVGVGASSVDSVYVSAEVQQNNFDLFAPTKWFRGAGQKGRAYVQWGPRIQTFEASVTEPYLFDRHLEFTVEGHRRGRWYDQYDLYRNGAMLELRYPVKFWPTWNPLGSLGLEYVPDFVQMDDCDSGAWLYNNKEITLTGQNGQESRYGDAWEHKFELFWAHDNRDNFRLATKGGTTRVYGDVVIGDNQFWRVGAYHRHYFPVWKRFGHVLMGNVRFETEDTFSGDMPIYDRMFLGGPRSIRGVRYRHASPLAVSQSGGDPLPWGGETLFVMNFEYTIPIVKMLRLAVFTDLGSVGEDTFDFNFGDTFTWSAGVGIRLDIPMFPIRLDFAAPFVKADHAETEVFSFMIGYDF